VIDGTQRVFKIVRPKTGANQNKTKTPPGGAIAERAKIGKTTIFQLRRFRLVVRA
jgi:hypothetical protein